MNGWIVLQQKIVECERCPRLRAHCREVASVKKLAFADWTYWGRPIPNFGKPTAGLLIVGLAPAAHGANRTGRMFTGDKSGEWLYRALHKAGFANQSSARTADDGLKLRGCTITAVCHCAPPDNKPANEEIANCRPWLIETIDQVQPQVIVALGQIAWNAALSEVRRRNWLVGNLPKFGHGARQELADGRWLLASYHPSQQNTFTGKLTEPMLDAVFAEARRLLSCKVQR